MPKKGLKTYFFKWRKAMQCCNQPYSFLSMYVINAQKKEEKKRVFKWVTDVFWWRTRRQKKCNTWQSNLPFVMVTGPELPSNQPESLYAKGERNSNKNETKRTVFKWVLDNGSNKHMKNVCRRQQSNVPVALGMLMASAKEFLLARRKEERKTRQRWEIC